jgi:broad specificity phosphatase PhoE
MIDLLLLRHGPTNASEIKAPLGKLDMPVNSYGQAIWPQVRNKILKLDIQQVLTSNLKRARNHALDLGLPCIISSDLDEQDFGDWNGIPWSKITGAKAFLEDPIDNVPPGGESFSSCINRVSRVTQTILTNNLPTLILAHSGTLRIILSHFLGISINRMLDLAWQPYGLSKIIAYDNQRGILCYHNKHVLSTRKINDTII